MRPTHADIVAARLALESAPPGERSAALVRLRMLVLAPSKPRPAPQAKPSTRGNRWSSNPPPDMTGVEFGGNRVKGLSRERTTKRGRIWEVECVTCGAVRFASTGRVNQMRKEGLGVAGCRSCAAERKTVKDRYCRSCGETLGREDMPRRCQACDRMGHRAGWRPDGHPIVARYRAGKRSKAALAQQAAAAAIAGLFALVVPMSEAVGGSGEKGAAP